MPRDGRLFASIGEAHVEDDDEELRQLVDARREGDGLRVLGRSLEKVRVMVLHHPGARSGRYDHGKGLWKEGHLSARHGPGLLVVAAVVRGLGAAGLAAGEDDADTLAFQELDSRQPRFGKKEIHDAGAEEVDGFGFHGSVLPANEASRISIGCAMGRVAPRSPRSLLIWSVQPGLALARRSAFTERTFSAFLRPISSEDSGATRL